MNVERAFRIVNESVWGKQFIKNATEFHNGLEMFKTHMAKLNADKFIKSAFIWDHTPEGADFWEQIDKEFTSAYNNKTCRVFNTISGISVVAKWYTNGEDANSDEFRALLNKNGIQYDSITKVFDKTTGRLKYFKACKQSSKIEEELP